VTISHLLAILMHLAIYWFGEYLETEPGYKCPEYCEVEHNHINNINEKNNASRNGNKMSERK
jgi:hypothetical protein